MTLQFDAVHQLMQAGVARNIFPGAVLAVSRGDRLVLEHAYGHADLFSGQPMGVGTIFDLASLTKPLATVLAVMALVRQGRLELDDTCGKFCPYLKDAGIAKATVRHLLQHRSGLKPWQPYFMRLRHLAFEKRRPALQEFLRQTPVLAPAGRRSDYSDLGYMVLQWVVEAVSETDLAAIVRNEVYSRLGIQDLFFNDTRRPVEWTERYAATQFCPWRHKLMLGHVDDDNAYISGGISGHAGLFGTAGAVIRLLQSLMAAENGEDHQGVFDSVLVKLFFASETGERWALGFDTPSTRGSSAGHCFPPDSIGHLGFTGTSFWVHRQQRIAVVLLTNRVHPFRFNAGIKAFRPQLHDAVMETVA